MVLIHMYIHNYYMHVVDSEKLAQVIHTQLLEQDLHTKGKVYYKRKDPQTCDCAQQSISNAH